MEEKTFIEKVEEKLTVENVLSILRNYEIEPHTIKNKRENELWFTTVCHHGDSHKLCFFKDSKRFFCYTNCGSMNLFQLLMKIKNCNFSVALKEVAREVGLMGFGDEGFFGTKETVTLSDGTIIRLVSNWGQRNIVKVNPKTVNIDTITIKDYEDQNNILDYFDKNVFFQGWIDEGISIKTMTRFGIRWYEMEKYIIIPHRDKNGKLIGIRRRSLKPEDSEGGKKYMPLIMKDGTSFEHSLGMNLYGLYENKESIERQGKIILTEGEKSVLLAESFYENTTIIENGKPRVVSGNIAVATCGFNISDYQISLLNELNIQEVIIGFDMDFRPNTYEYTDFDRKSEEFKGYLNYKLKLYNLALKVAAKTNLKVSIIWDREFEFSRKKFSPFDGGRDTFDELLRSRIPIVPKREEEVKAITEAKVYEQMEQTLRQKEKQKKEDFYFFNMRAFTSNNLNQKIQGYQKKQTKKSDWTKFSSYNYTWK